MIPDFLDLLRALLAADARFMIVGAYAVGVHGRPRATKDLDVWVEASAANAPKVIAALREFGAPLMGLTEAESCTNRALVYRPASNQVVSMSSQPSAVFASKMLGPRRFKRTLPRV
jgi:hypothetical protein